MIRAYTVTLREGSEVEAAIELAARGRTAAASAREHSGQAALMVALREAAAKLDLTLPRPLDCSMRAASSANPEIEVALTFVSPRGPLTLYGVAADPLRAVIVASEKPLQLCSDHQHG